MEPATAVVPCSGDEHRVTWRRGKVVLEDHDLSAERTMLAFGGEVPACLRVLQLWRNMHSWAMSAELFRQMQARVGDDPLLAPGPLGAVRELGLLLTWERAWRRSSYYSDHGRLLLEQLRARALDPLRQHLRFWMRRRGCRRISSVDVQLQRRGQEASLSGEMDSVGVRAAATLGTAWVLGVWARHLAVVDGAFVVEVADDEEAGSPEVLSVRAARWEQQGGGRSSPVVAPARAERGADGGWVLTWLDAPAAE